MPSSQLILLVAATHDKYFCQLYVVETKNEKQLSVWQTAPFLTFREKGNSPGSQTVISSAAYACFLPGSCLILPLFAPPRLLLFTSGLSVTPTETIIYVYRSKECSTTSFSPSIPLSLLHLPHGLVFVLLISYTESLQHIHSLWSSLFPEPSFAIDEVQLFVFGLFAVLQSFLVVYW